MDTKEKQEKEEVISIAGLLSEEELKEIGLSEEEIKNPTEEISTQPSLTVTDS